MFFIEAKKAVRDLSAKWSARVAVNGVIVRLAQSHAKLVEDKPNRPATIDDLKTEILPHPEEPGGHKVARLKAVSPIIEARNVWIPE